MPGSEQPDGPSAWQPEAFPGKGKQIEKLFHVENGEACAPRALRESEGSLKKWGSCQVQEKESLEVFWRAHSVVAIVISLLLDILKVELTSNKNECFPQNCAQVLRC